MLNSKKLFILNNFFMTVEIAKSYKEIVFCPQFKSSIQERFFKARFQELLKVVSHIRWGDVHEISENDDKLSWDAYNETYILAGSILPLQNRLFKDFKKRSYKSFTNFRKKAEHYLPDYYLDAITPYDQEILRDLDYYFNDKRLASTYFETRNGLVGRDFSTKFSHYLSCGALDVRYLYNRVRDFEKEYGANKSTGWIIFELLWREFFYWDYQARGKAYFSEAGIQGKNDFSSFQYYTFEELEQLKAHSFFYACLNELKETGFLSNRARQIFASIWINDLELNWRSGASFFEQYLIDYDVYSNYGNWMYLAGVGHDPRGKRYFNVEKQLSQYDPDGLYLKRWL